MASTHMTPSNSARNGMSWRSTRSVVTFGYFALARAR
jgi:hypothetical protein